MRVEKLKIGTKIGTELFQVECSVKLPDTIEEMLGLARNSLPFVLAMFCRGWRIWCQEQSGARDFIQLAKVQEREAEGFAAKVQAIVDNADPTAPPKRTGRPAGPKDVKATPEMVAAMKKGDLSKFAELLAAQGVKVNITQ